MSSPSAHYTLPGVMHYLQTEYTRNERDKINWELERCEMKSRIAQLEGENRDLKYELNRLKTKIDFTNAGEQTTSERLQSWEQEEDLLNSKLAVQENVKEIVYLLKSPHITEQLESWNKKDDPVKKLEPLNLFGSVGAKADIVEVQDKPDTFLDVTNNETHADNTDLETIVNSERPRSSSLFSTKSNDAVRFYTYRILQYHLSPISKLKLLGNSMLSFGSDGLLKHWLVEPNLNSNEKLTKSFYSVPTLLGIFWLSKTNFITVDETSIKLWNVDQSEPILSWDGLKDLEGLMSIDFKNKWLILSFINEIHVWELKITDSSIEKLNEFVIKGTNRVLKCLLGLTEKSLIVLNGSNKQNVKVSIFDFQGSLLQKIDLSHHLSQFSLTNNELALNRSTSKLLVRFDNETLIYSFDQKRTVLVSSTGDPTISSIFLNDSEYTVTALEDGTIVVKSIKEDGKQIKKYNHYETPEKLPTDAAPLVIASTIIDSTPVIVSGGYNGTIRLEKVMNI